MNTQIHSQHPVPACAAPPRATAHAGTFHHISLAARAEQPAFDDFGDARLVCSAIRRCEHDGTQLLAWVLTLDRLHLIAQLRDETPASAVRRLKTATTRALNGANPRTGALWRSGFRSQQFHSDRDVIAAARYLLLMPLREGLATRIGAWPYWDAAWLHG